MSGTGPDPADAAPDVTMAFDVAEDVGNDSADRIDAGAGDAPATSDADGAAQTDVVETGAEASDAELDDRNDDASDARNESDGGAPDASAEAGALDGSGRSDGTSPVEAGGPTCDESSCGRSCCGNRCVANCTGCAVGSSFCPFNSLVNANGYCVATCSACALPGCAP